MDRYYHANCSFFWYINNTIMIVRLYIEIKWWNDLVILFFFQYNLYQNKDYSQDVIKRTSYFRTLSLLHYIRLQPAGTINSRYRFLIEQFEITLDGKTVAWIVEMKKERNLNFCSSRQTFDSKELRTANANILNCPNTKISTYSKLAWILCLKKDKLMTQNNNQC